MKKVYCDRPPGKMVTGKLKIVDKMKRVPEWLNSPIWSSKSASLVVVSRGHTGEENACGAEREVGMSEPTMSESDRISTQTEKSDVEGTKESDDKTNEGRPLRQSSDLDVPSTPGPSSPGQFSGLNFKRGPSFDSRLDRFLSELSKKVINLAELQLLASEGIPDYEGLRATIWKNFLYDVVYSFAVTGKNCIPRSSEWPAAKNLSGTNIYHKEYLKANHYRKECITKTYTYNINRVQWCLFNVGS
eukprot:Gb_39884 [translate_table: standard]